jgi:spermidine synthase
MSLRPKLRALRTFREDGQTLVLRERGDTFDLVIGTVVLLSSAALETERLFGHLARDLSDVPPQRIVVGGLGFAATVRGVLDVVPATCRVRVVEKLATVIDLARGDLAHLTAGALDDPRVEVTRGDVLDVLAEERDVDAVLLDVDNGPNWASFRTNARLYAPAGLKVVRDALRPGGALAVWSGYPAEPFIATLRAARFAPSVVPLHERGVLRARAYIGRRTD